MARLLADFHEPGFVDDIELALGFLEPGPEQDFQEVAVHLTQHLHNEARALLSVEERFAIEAAQRDNYNAFRRSLGEVIDPDEPFDFPEPQ